jgi:hypothetical protein
MFFPSGILRRDHSTERGSVSSSMRKANQVFPQLTERWEGFAFISHCELKLLRGVGILVLPLKISFWSFGRPIGQRGCCSLAKGPASIVQDDTQ